MRVYIGFLSKNVNPGEFEEWRKTQGKVFDVLEAPKVEAPKIILPSQVENIQDIKL